MPLIFLVWQSFLTPETAGQASEFTLDNYASAYSDPETWHLLSNSLQFSAGTAVFAFLTGTVLAWMNERTNTPLKSLIFGLSLIPLIIPGMLFVVAWILLLSPKIGMINLALQHLFNTDYVFFNIYSMWGMIWVQGLHYSPVAFLFMSSAFRSMDPSLEEAAMMGGANLWQITSRITLPLTWPAILATLLILFINAIEAFEGPALQGLPVGIEVFTSAIYLAIGQYPSQTGLASAYGVLMLVITGVGVYFQTRLSNRSSRYSTVTGKGFRPRVMDLGRWRYLTSLLFILYFLAIVVLPFLTLLWSSLQRFYSAPSMKALGELTLAAYSNLLKDSNLLDAAANSVFLGLSSATVIMLLTSVICWIVVKTKLPGRWLLDHIATLPLVFPGVVLGLAIMTFYLQFNVGIYGTMWIMFIAYLTRFMPYGLRYNTTSMLQMHKDLEESAQMSGASWGSTFWRIVLPLLKPGFLAGWIYILIVSIRELSSSILLYSPDTRVLSIMMWEQWQDGQYVQLSALGVMLVLVLFFLVMVARMLGKRVGVKEA
ncbi:ABC transporter permease subunit [Bordetella petrii]|nr:ABC transporter permease subunit [Bordetella petrii]